MMQMKSVGEILRETRENKQLTIRQVSNTIKIRECMLEALEKGDYSAFSSDMHLKGFLRAYADFLGINEEKVLALYRREREIKLYSSESKDKKTRKESSLVFNFSNFFNPKSLLTIIGIIILVGVSFFFYSQWKEFSKPPVLEITSPKANDLIKTDTFTIEGFTGDPSVKVVLDGTVANYIDANGNFKVTAKFAEPGSKRFIVVATNQLGKKTERQLDLTYAQEKTEAKTENKIKIRNNLSSLYTITVAKDIQPVPTTVVIQPATTIEIVFNSKVSIGNFDKNKLSVFLGNDTTPTSSIDSKDFSIMIESGSVIIKNSK